MPVLAGRSGQIVASHLLGVDEVNTEDGEALAQQTANDVEQVHQSAGGAKKHESQIVAFQRRAGSKFLKNAPEIADADGEQLGDRSAARIGVTSLEEVGGKTHEGMGHPEMRCLSVIREHAQVFLDACTEFVKQMGVDANSGGDDKVAHGEVAREIAIRYLTERDTPRLGAEQCPGRFYWVEREIQVVSESICGPQRNDAEGD